MAESSVFDSITFHECYLVNLFKVMKCGNFNEKMFNRKRNEILRINEICKTLFANNSIIQLIDNQNEILCPHYPPTIVIPYQRMETDIDSRASFVKNNSLLFQSIYKSTQARCRNRFVVPTMNYKNKFICRSSTLSGSLEMIGKQYFGSVFGSSSESNAATGKEAFDKIRGDDMLLLDNLKVKYIFDLMLENKKMMFGVPMSSSEKIDRHNRYKEFTIISLPYPGCEFFSDWRKSNYKMSDLYFQWDHHEINSKLQVELPFMPTMALKIDWTKYTEWDLTQLTSNYLKLILGILIEDNSSILIHCISGWDRTPLFVSLVRCLMWSDGLMHQSLDASQMLYLTLAYDWYLFGHMVKSRLKVGEEILNFTFMYLRYAARDLSTSVSYVYGNLEDSDKSDNDGLSSNGRESVDRVLFERMKKLEDLVSLFETLYEQELSCLIGCSKNNRTKSFVDSASTLVNGLINKADK